MRARFHPIEPLESRIAPATLNVANAQVQETDGTVDMTFEFVLDASPSETLTVRFETVEGSARAGADFLSKAGTVVWEVGTLDLVRVVNVQIVGDYLKELSESFALALSIPEGATGPTLPSNPTGTILPDADSVEVLDGGTTVRWTDVDGDLVTLKVSSPIFEESAFSSLLTFDSSSSEIGKPVLQRADLTGLRNGGFAIITAEANGGDGLVHVGELNAAGVRLKELSSHGDVARFIVAGADVIRFASLAEKGTANLPASSPSLASSVTAKTGLFELTSGGIKDASLRFFANVKNVLIAGDIVGGSSADSGSIRFDGNVANLHIEGSLVGDAGAASGSIVAAKTIKTFAIGDGSQAIVGGEGASSGRFTVSKIGSATLDGFVKGGGGRFSGVFDAAKARSLSVTGDVIGGTEFRTGTIFIGTLGKAASVDGSLVGGTGAESGVFRTDSKAKSVAIAGLEGGGGSGSGAVVLQKINSLQIGSGSGTAIQGGSGAASGAASFISAKSVSILGDIVGDIGADSGRVFAQQSAKSLSLFGDLLGGSGARSGVLLALDGSFDSLQIAGRIVGGDGTQSGAATALSMKSVTIGGGIDGGAGSRSGFLEIRGDAKAKSIVVIGSVVGGTGEGSGSVSLAGRVDTLEVRGDVAGASGSRSGRLNLSGGAGNVLIQGDLAGGSGSLSGLLEFAKDVAGLTIRGKIIGGSGDRSGGIGSGSLIKNLSIESGIQGGHNASATESLNLTGFVVAGRIGSATVGGDIIAGTTAGGALTNSGVFRSTSDIGSLVVAGSLLGNDAVPAVISAYGQANLGKNAKADVAIGSLAILGTANEALILAGYGFENAFGPTGRPVNADASIGSVTIAGAATATSIVAGIESGAGGSFGDGNDSVIQVDPGEDFNVRNRMDLISVIGSVSLGPGSGGTPANDARTFAIMAGWVQSVSVAGVAIPLLIGSGNDIFPGTPIGSTPGTLADGFDFHVVEVA